MDILCFKSDFKDTPVSNGCYEMVFILQKIRKGHVCFIVVSSRIGRNHGT